MNIRILDDNDYFVIVDKPYGLSVHNAAESTNDLDLIQILETQLKGPVLPVHRLDKETSGLMVLAKNAESARKIIESAEAMTKKYLAVVRGILNPPEAIWNFPISDKAEGFKNPQGLAKDRKASQTKYKVLKQNKYFSLIECEILTGRQHQIRKHAAISKHAIIGDTRYGDKTYNKKMSEIYGDSRMYLHAWELAFHFEKNGKNDCFHYKTEMPSSFGEIIQN